MPLINETMIGGVNAKGCTATSADILSGKTAAVGKEIIAGTMANNGNVDTAIVDGVLQDGYTSGGMIQNLSEENIKKGVMICGKTGSYDGIPSTPSVRVVIIASDTMSYVASLNHKLTFVSWKTGGHQIVTFVFLQSTLLVIYSTCFYGYDTTDDPNRTETFYSFPFTMATDYKYPNKYYMTADGEIKNGSLYLKMSGSSSHKSEKFTVCYVD